MKNLIEKFEKENEVLIENHLEDIGKILVRRIIAVVIVFILILILHFYRLSLLEGQVRDDAIMFTFPLTLFSPVLCFILVHAATSIPVKSKMYTRLNFKAKKFIQDEILLDLQSLLRKRFILDSYVEERLTYLIKNQKKWIDNDGVLMAYQKIDDKSVVLSTRDHISYHLFYWSYSSEGFKVQYARDFAWMEEKLFIEESGESKLINK